MSCSWVVVSRGEMAMAVDGAVLGNMMARMVRDGWSWSACVEGVGYDSGGAVGVADLVDWTVSSNVSSWPVEV